MKNIVKIIVLSIFSAVLFASCEKDSEGLSEVVSYPQLTITGGNFIVIVQGGEAFVDPGAEAVAGDVTLPVTATGSVDVTTPGLYPIIYSASVDTEIGMMTSSAERKVLVVSQPLTVDHSGNYIQSGGTRARTATKQADALGWYRFSDAWWQAAAIPVEFVDFGTSLQVIPGNCNYGPFDGTASYNSATHEITFSLHFTSGVNQGVSWTSIWTKQ
ncbi:MAG: DUF5011 domain-containing protein [Prevotellaceae bacterium]|jgi:hypothetical protein|nr:DUF5011 domain-containing protein [Prevotellaceae bacterium]